MKEYYVYYLIDSSTNIPFYVGKGKGDRMYSHVHAVKVERKGYLPNKHLYNKIYKLLQENIKIKYKKVYQTDDEEKAYQREEEEIKKIGLENLCNIMPGGNGVRFTEEIKKKISEATKINSIKYWKGKFRSEETKKKISNTLKGIPSILKGKTWEELFGKEKANEMKKKNSESHKGYILTEETRKKLIESHKGKNTWMKGKKLSEETKRKISKFTKNKSYEERYGSKERAIEIAEKISKANKISLKGKYLSEEHKKKIFNSLKNTHHWKKLEELNLF